MQIRSNDCEVDRTSKFSELEILILGPGKEGRRDETHGVVLVDTRILELVVVGQGSRTGVTVFLHHNHG
jgi:hypothetical protein